MKLPTFRTAVNWLDENILLVMGAFLLAFIPLYPKLPLFDVLPGYIVRVRLEDFFILLTAFIWLIQVIRKKVTWKSPVLAVIIAYAVAGFLSTVSAVVLTKTVPPEILHIGKTGLHYFRYLEYFSLFAILFSAIKTKKHVQYVLGVVALTVFLVTAYGYGQRYFYWPVYSTMNREFSKGLRLYLTEHARVQSTFGGHYDLAAYLVIALPFILAIAFAVKSVKGKILLQIVHWAGVWLIVTSGSRSSFVGYMVGVVLVLLFSALNQKTWLKRIAWGFSRSFITLGLIAVMLLRFGDEMYERFVQVLQGYPVIYKEYVMIESQSKTFFEQTLPVTLGLKDIELPKAEIPKDAISTETAEQLEAAGQENVLVSSDERPVTTRPSDVYVDVPDIVEVATISASGEATTVMVDKGPRTYSDCAIKRGLSLCIRLETLWPRAIEGFKRNPLFGSGYATLTKTVVGEFTEAESTDNNFLRTLGETGLLGFVSFYGVILVILALIVRQLFSSDWLARGLTIGFVAATVGLLINAVYIDVFAASKVALTYWGLAGLIIAYNRLYKSQQKRETLVITPMATAKPKTVTHKKPKRKKFKQV